MPQIIPPPANIACPFCDKEVIISQLIQTSSKWYIIRSNKEIEIPHLLVIPHRHIRTLDEMEHIEVFDYIKMCKEACRIIKEQSGLQPMSFINAPQSQSVFHFHQHFFPSKFKIHEVHDRLTK